MMIMIMMVMMMMTMIVMMIIMIIMIMMTLYISGQVGVELGTGEMARGVEAQAELIFTYLEEILRTAGAGMDNIVRTTVYMKNIQDLRNGLDKGCECE